MPIARPRHFPQRPDRNPLSFAGWGELVRDHVSGQVIPKRLATRQRGGWVSVKRADGTLDRQPEDPRI